MLLAESSAVIFLCSHEFFVVCLWLCNNVALSPIRESISEINLPLPVLPINFKRWMCYFCMFLFDKLVLSCCCCVLNDKYFLAISFASLKVRFVKETFNLKLEELEYWKIAVSWGYLNRLIWP